VASDAGLGQAEHRGQWNQSRDDRDQNDPRTHAGAEQQRTRIVYTKVDCRGDAPAQPAQTLSHGHLPASPR
jgi:hypothetical protein